MYESPDPIKRCPGARNGSIPHDAQPGPSWPPLAHPGCRGSQRALIRPFRAGCPIGQGGHPAQASHRTALAAQPYRQVIWQRRHRPRFRGSMTRIQAFRMPSSAVTGRRVPPRSAPSALPGTYVRNLIPLPRPGTRQLPPCSSRLRYADYRVKTRGRDMAPWSCLDRHRLSAFMRTHVRAMVLKRHGFDV